MVKAIDSKHTKEETDAVFEVLSEPPKMIANVQSGTPNILLANDGFRLWVNFDLVAAYRMALDTHIVDQIEAANVQRGGGTNAFEAVLYSQEFVGPLATIRCSWCSYPRTRWLSSSLSRRTAITTSSTRRRRRP